MKLSVLFRSKLSRVGLAAVIIAVAVTIYAVFMIHAMPSMLKNYLENKIAESIGGEAHIGSIEIQPFKLAVAVRELSVANNAIKLVWDSVYVDMQLRSLPTRSICLDEFRLHNPKLEVILEQHKEGEPSATQLAAEAFLARTNMPVNIRRFIIQNGALELLDKRSEKEKRFGIGPISFSLEDFSTQYSAGEGNNYNLQFTGLNGGFFRWNGSLQWSPFLSEGEMEIRGLDIIQLRDFYQEHLPFYMQSGGMDLHTRYKVSETPEFGFTLENAKLVLNKAALLADSSKLSARIASVNIDSIQLSTINRTLFAGNVVFDSANASYILRKIPEMPSSKLFEFARHNASSTDPADSNMFSAFLKRISNFPRWQVKVDSMRVTRAQIKILDSITTPDEHILSNMQLSFSKIANNSSDSVKVAGSATLYSGKIDWQGSVNLFPFRALANLNISNFPLTPFQNYLSQETWLTLQRGQAAARLNARLRPATDSSQKDTLLFAGDAEIDSLRLNGRNNQEFIRTQNVAVKELNIMLAPDINWQANTVNIQAPSVNLIWYAKAPANYSQIKKKKSRAEKEESIPYNINRINFSRGIVNLTDRDPATPFSYRTVSVQGNLRNFSNQKHNAVLTMEGKMGGYAPFSLRGLINLSGRNPKLNLTAKAANQDLVAFSPYFGKYAGYQVAKGQVAFQADYDIKNNKLQGNNHVIIQHLTFGEAVKSEEATNLPVRLAASLLSDKDGIIDLDFVITGDLDDPEFSVGSLIWKVVKNLLGKVMAAPFRSLMSLIGSNADPEIVTFSPGSSQIDKTQQETLKSLAQALMQRSELQLDVYGNADSTLDGNAIREARQQLTTNDLRNLAHARAQNIKIELVNMNASLGERIFVVEGNLSNYTANLKIREW